MVSGTQLCGGCNLSASPDRAAALHSLGPASRGWKHGTHSKSGRESERVILVAVASIGPVASSGGMGTAAPIRRERGSSTQRDSLAVLVFTPADATALILRGSANGGTGRRICCMSLLFSMGVSGAAYDCHTRVTSADGD